jgi:hypothetical protein
VNDEYLVGTLFAAIALVCAIGAARLYLGITSNTTSEIYVRCLFAVLFAAYAAMCFWVGAR